MQNDYSVRNSMTRIKDSLGEKMPEQIFNSPSVMNNARDLLE